MHEIKITLKFDNQEDADNALSALTDDNESMFDMFKMFNLRGWMIKDHFGTSQGCDIY